MKPSTSRNQLTCLVLSPCIVVFLQVTTSLEQQATESSMCERNTTAGLSTQASVDSASLMVSELADIPDRSCSSEDLCSLEVQGSDSSPYGTLRTAPTNSSCTSLDPSVRSSVCREARSPACPDHSESSMAQDSAARSPEKMDAQERDDTSASVPSRDRASTKLTLPVPPASEIQPCASSSGAVPSAAAASAPSPLACPSPSPSGRPRGSRLCFSVWTPQPSSTSAHGSSTASERPRTLRARRYRKLARIVRSTSDPVSCNSITRSESCGCTSVGNQPQQESPQTPSDQACMELSGGTVPQCPKPSSRGAKKQKDGGKVDLRLKALHPTSTERPHSLADLKTYKDTKILVARFLEHSSCSLPPEVQQVVNSIKYVIKSDEKHMEEAIFSASILDQVMTQSQRILSSPRKHVHDDLHLQSCGALSSPSPSLRRPRRVTGQTAPATSPGHQAPYRPQSLVSVCRETIL
ncbi:hypothetical protein NFI96_022504 [Prochilodus magdalenae]|nr:hypothetical protein NFI96_022504 [Prochilodus magdalenae]